MDEDILPESDETVVLDDTPEEDEGDVGVRALLETIRGKYTKASDARVNDEKRWLNAYQNYRGIYSDDMSFTEAEKSRIFVKVTKTKVLAAYGQITDVLFANNSFPLSIEPTELPEKVAEAVHFDPQQQQQAPSSPYGFPGDGNELQPGDTLNTLMDRLGPLSDPLSEIDGVKEGAGATPSSATFYPAMLAAKKIRRRSRTSSKETASSILSLYVRWPLRHRDHERSVCCRRNMPTGMTTASMIRTSSSYKSATYLSGTSTLTQTQQTWTTQTTSSSVTSSAAASSVISRSAHTSIAKPSICVSRWARTSIASIGKIRCVITSTIRTSSVSDKITGAASAITIWKRWASNCLKACRMQTRCRQTLGFVLWLIRLFLNPFKPMRIPFMAVPYEMNPYSFFGVGLAENMEDMTLMNGFMRMAVDNVTCQATCIEIDETNLVPGQDMAIYPGRCFVVRLATGQAIFGTKFPNVAGENMQLFDKARQLADESTGFLLRTWSDRRYGRRPYSIGYLDAYERRQR